MLLHDKRYHVTPCTFKILQAHTTMLGESRRTISCPPSACACVMHAIFWAYTISLI